MRGVGAACKVIQRSWAGALGDLARVGGEKEYLLRVWFDSHCHLDFAAFEPDRAAVVGRARAAGIRHIFVPGVRASQWARIAALRDDYPEVELGTGVGLHPYFAHELSVEARRDALARLPQAAAQFDAWAIGECGLDGRVAKQGGLSLDEQVDVLDVHLDSAAGLQLPIVLHIVAAHGRMLSRLRARGFGGVGVLHSYTGPAELVPEYTEMGFFFGFAAAVTRPAARKTHRAVQAVPAERLLVETDAPDQVPTGYRPAVEGRNEPAGLLAVARAVATLRQMDVSELAELTSANARRLYGLG